MTRTRSESVTDRPASGDARAVVLWTTAGVIAAGRTPGANRRMKAVGGEHHSQPGTRVGCFPNFTRDLLNQFRPDNGHVSRRGDTQNDTVAFDPDDSHFYVGPNLYRLPRAACEYEHQPASETGT
jgi:hypothetical protein